MGVLFVLILLLAIYTLYRYFMASNYKAIILAVALYFILSLLIKSKTTVIFLTILFTNCFVLCALLSRILLLTKVFSTKTT